MQRTHRTAVVTALLTLGAVAAGGDVVLDIGFADEFTAIDLGPPSGVPLGLGGIAFHPDDPNVLLIGGDAVSADGALYAVEVARDCLGHIVGYAGEATPYADAGYIDGGLVVGPDGVLFYTTYDTNTLGQILPGSTAPDRVVDLSPLGMNPSTGGMAIVPTGMPGAGRLKFTSYDTGSWHDAVLVPDGVGTFAVAEMTERVVGLESGPEGSLYIPSLYAAFDADSVLISKWDDNRIDAYEIDGQGDPILGTERPFAHFAGPEGATLDRETGDLLFSALSADARVVVFSPIDTCPADLAPFGGDSKVGHEDLLSVLTSWTFECVPADIDQDGAVGLLDLLTVLSNWGPCP